MAPKYRHKVSIQWDKDAYDHFPHPFTDIAAELFGNARFFLNEYGVWYDTHTYEPFTVHYHFKFKRDADTFRSRIRMRHLDLELQSDLRGNITPYKQQYEELFTWLDRNVGSRLPLDHNTYLVNDLAMGQNWISFRLNAEQQRVLLWGHVPDTAIMELALTRC